jgi:hypothetical protein
MTHCQRQLISAIMIMGEIMKNVHDKIVSIAVKSSELLELVQWDLPVDLKVAKGLIDDLSKLLDEVKEEIS